MFAQFSATHTGWLEAWVGKRLKLIITILYIHFPVLLLILSDLTATKKTAGKGGIYVGRVPVSLST